MPDTFAPHKSEEVIVVTIKRREAVLIQKLRKHAFGQFIIHKANNVLTRIEIRDSQLIEEDTDIELD